MEFLVIEDPLCLINFTVTSPFILTNEPSLSPEGPQRKRDLGSS